MELSRPDPAGESDAGSRDGEKKPDQRRRTGRGRDGDEKPQAAQTCRARLLRNADDGGSVLGKALGAPTRDHEVVVPDEVL
ncbi:hypothetical protein [Curtobacterium sp. MCBD17_040]|uniref:hypothetical protein n=1 Tax=Curtobacterium sp. MCBD17_040 TaxID=2175674 RepID=UPI0011B6C6DA|nr:hypothetical protein [Curtobacterium sp. MCBD17_040]WIB62976.1 hypothetical protein DEI94_12550 [Curtobacterium sp. MCBD17_040]